MTALRRRFVLSISLVAVAALAVGCAKATVVRAPWGTPLDAVTKAAQGLAVGFSFRGDTTADGVRSVANGEEIPAESKYRLFQLVSGGTARIETEMRLIGDELWMRIDGVVGSGDWGHFADGSLITETANVVGPSVWVPELLAQVTSVERIDEREYGGLTGADSDKTGLDRAIVADLPDEAEEVEFSVLLNTDGSLNMFSFEIDDTAQGDVEIVYVFTMHGSPSDVTPPNGKVVEVTDENMLEWMSGV